jgi:CRP-like cAMP-binding protein
MLKPEMRLFTVRCERDASGVQLRREAFRRLIREYPLVLDRFKRTCSWREARAWRRVQRAVVWKPSDCYDLAAWIIHAALRGYLVRRRNQKADGGRSWNSFIKERPPQAKDVPAAADRRQSLLAYSSPVLARLDIEEEKARATVNDGSVEGKLLALENKVAESHKHLSNQIAELARLLEHASFGPTAPTQRH